ncbi:SPOR domain-containing protein [Thiohalorhabdus methylotrophus]|uniref:SPOR domain-containing protein n=1 Tax=Thiohalorhabdus methylotrophus TaxID=3242694 RepID=A0ABV4TU06_9GAMM
MSDGEASGSGGGHKPARFYKFVGALVVLLVVGVVVLPLWFGGEETDRSRVVEIQPESLQSRTQRESDSSFGASGEDGGFSPDQATDKGVGGQEKWWRSADAEDDSGSSPDIQEASTEQETSDASSASEPEPSAAGKADPGAGATEAGSDPDTGSGSKVAEDEAETESAPTPEPAGEEQADAPAAEEVAKAEPERPFWTVMVGSFRDPANAGSLRDRLRENGFEAAIVTATVKGEEWNRVVVGDGKSREAVQSLVSSLEQAGFGDLLVLRLD